MYSASGGYGSGLPPELSNNPFIDHPTNAHSRFPDINGTDEPPGTNQFTSWLKPSSPISPVSSNPTGYAGLGQSSQNSYGQSYQQPQPTGWQSGGGYSQQGGYGGGYGQQQQQVQPQPTGRAFQPTSSFGQQLDGQLNAAGYTAPLGAQQTQQQPQYTGYPQQQQYNVYGQGQPQYTGLPPQQSTQYLSEFDPYSQQQHQQQAKAPASATTTATSGGSQYRPLHPREFVQRNKSELEAWDTYAWKQLINSFDALKDAWAVRKKEIEARGRVLGGQGLFGGGGGYGYGNYNQSPDIERLEQMLKDADSNVDVVAAGSFQLQEVQAGYRQSGDLASKKRVRESINAALQMIPDWPPQNW